MPLLKLQPFNFSDIPSSTPVPLAAVVALPGENYHNPNVLEAEEAIVINKPKQTPLRKALSWLLKGVIAAGQWVTIISSAAQVVVYFYPYLLVLGVAYAIASRTSYKNFANKILDKAQKIIDNNIKIVSLATHVGRILQLVFNFPDVAPYEVAKPIVGGALWFAIENTTLAVASIWGAKINGKVAHLGIDSEDFQSPAEFLVDAYNYVIDPEIQDLREMIGWGNEANATNDVIAPEDPASRTWQLAGAAAAVTTHAFAKRFVAGTVPVAIGFVAPILPAFLLAVGATVGNELYEAKDSIAERLAGRRSTAPAPP